MARQLFNEIIYYSGSFEILFRQIKSFERYNMQSSLFIMFNVNRAHTQHIIQSISQVPVPTVSTPMTAIRPLDDGTISGVEFQTLPLVPVHTEDVENIIRSSFV